MQNTNDINDITVEEKIRKAKNQYQKEWRSKNKEKVKAINKRYWINRYNRITKGGEDVE